MFQKMRMWWYGFSGWWLAIVFARNPAEGLRILSQQTVREPNPPEYRIMIASVMHALVRDGKITMQELQMFRSTFNERIAAIQEGVIWDIDRWSLPEYIEGKIRTMLDDKSYRYDCIRSINGRLEDLSDESCAISLVYGSAWAARQFREMYILINRFGIDLDRFVFQPWKLLQILQRVEAGIKDEYAADRLTSAGIGMSLQELGTLFVDFRKYLEQRQRLARNW